MNEKIVSVYRWLISLTLLIAIFSCQKETGFRPLPESVMLFIAAPPSIQVDSAVSGTLPARLYATLISSGSDSLKRYGFCYSSIRPLPTIADSVTQATSGLPATPASIVLSSSQFQRNKLYYVRAFAENKQGVGYSESVITMLVPDNRSTPVVITSAIENVSAASANVIASLQSDGQSAITAYGICYSVTQQDPDLTDQVSITATSLSGTLPFPYSQLLLGLSNNSTYYVRAFATNELGTSYGERKSFRTTSAAAVAPTVQTDNVQNLTTTTATVDGAVTSKGTAEITSYGFCYSATNANPTTADVLRVSGTTLTAALPFAYSSSLSGFTANTSYFIRAYATTSAGTSYGVTRSFRTLANATAPPVVQTTEVTSTSITTTAATVKGNLQSPGTAAITRYGFCYSATQANPTITDPVVVAGSSNPSAFPSVFSANLTGLSSGTAYTVRAFATNSVGTAYGSTITFRTVALATSAPAVQTVNVSGVSYSSANVLGNLVGAGSASLTSYGVVYSASTATPTLADSKIITGTSSPGTFPQAYTTTLTGLNSNTGYSARAFATNSVGTSYGEVKRFVTLIATPSVTTDQATFTPATGSVNVKGTLQGSGASAVTRYGICYSTTNTNPTIADNPSDAGTSAGTYPFSFNKAIVRLPANTYYVRAYAFNGQGVAYGNVVTVTVYTSPVVATESAVEKNAEAGIETLLGSITNSGSASIQEYGFCYTKSSNVGRGGFGVGEANIAVVKQTSPVPTFFPFRYTNDVTVSYNMDYSYRAYVKTANGYFYGDIKTFSISYKP